MLEIHKLKYLKTFIVSEHKTVRLFQEGEKYYIELTGNGYVVKFLSGKTLKRAEKRCIDVIKKIRAGWSTLEPFWF